MKRVAAYLLVFLMVMCSFVQAEGGFRSDPDAIEVAAQSVLMLEVYDANDDLIATGSGFVAFNNRTIVTKSVPHLQTAQTRRECRFRRTALYKPSG